MNKQIKYILTAAVAVAVIITIVSAAFYTVAMMNEFDHVLGYFNVGSVSAAVGMYLPMAVALVGIACWILTARKASFRGAPEVNVPTIFSAVLVGLLMIVSSVMTFVAGGAENISIAAAVFGIIGGVYFLLMPFTGGMDFMSILSFAPPVWAAMRLLEEYFRDGAPINSPIRTSSLAMYALLLLFFAEEIRFYINRQIVGAWYFSILTALAFTGTASVSKLIVFFAGIEGFDFNFLELALGVALVFFLLGRLTAAPGVLGEYIPPVKSQKKSAPAHAKGAAYTDGEE